MAAPSPVVVSGLLHRRALHLLPVQILLPAYWVLHSAAAIAAAWELVADPHRWRKTTHGVTQISRAAEPLFGRPDDSGRVAAEAQVRGVDIG